MPTAILQAMPDEYMVLRRAYADGNTSWRFVRYCSYWLRESERIEKSRGRYQVMDLYCIVPVEGVSDIPKHVLWLGVAVSKSRIKKCVKLSDSHDNWLIEYEGLNARSTMMVTALGSMSKNTPIKIACECLRTSPEVNMKFRVNEISIALEAIEVCDRWAQDQATLDQVLEAEKSLPVSGSVLVNDTRRACLVITNNHDAIAALSIILRGLIAIVTLATKSRTVMVSKDIEMGYIIREHAPLPDVLYSLNRAPENKHV